MSDIWETRNFKAMAEENWHPASEPPDTDRVVLLRIDHKVVLLRIDHKDGPSASIFKGRYNAYGRYERRMSSREQGGSWRDRIVLPNWWKELPEWGRDE